MRPIPAGDAPVDRSSEVAAEPPGMLDATVSTSQPTAGRLAAPAGVSTPILGGDAWVVPYEAGAPAWITVAAPQIRVTDLRAQRVAAATR